MAKDKSDEKTVGMFEDIFSVASSPPEADQGEARARERKAVVNSESKGSSLSMARLPMLLFNK